MAEEYGRVAITPRGDWSETKQYEAGDIVTYNKGSSYLAHTTPPVGTLPTNEGYYQVSALGGSLATADAPGVVKPDNVTLSVDEDGTISVNTASQTGLGAVKGSDDIKVESDGQLKVNTDFEQAVNLANIITNEAFTNILGKISKSIAITMGLDENALLNSMLTNQMENSTNKIPTAALVYNLNQTVTTLNSNLTTVDNKLNNKMDSSRIRTAAGVFDNTSTTQTFNISGSSNGDTYLLAAQIQLFTGVWSDLRTMDGIMRIDYNAPLVNVIKSNAEIYAGYFVRFVFLD